MKFFRMDSDFPHWGSTSRCLKELGDKGLTVYMFLYAMLAERYAGDEVITIDYDLLRERSRMTRPKFRHCLVTLGRIFNFDVTFTEERLNGDPVFIKVRYEIFLKKQRNFKRYGDGKFAPTADRSGSDYGRETKTKIDMGDKERTENITKVLSKDSSEYEPPPIESEHPSPADDEGTIFSPEPRSRPDVNKNKPATLVPRPGPECSEFDRKAASTIFELVASLNRRIKHCAKFPPTMPATWPESIHAIRDGRGHSQTDITRVIAWTFISDFWKDKIQSATGFENNFDKLLYQMKKETSDRQRGFGG